jgi:uncharacterized membrane protein YraQ (UPF0718 family)
MSLLSLPMTRLNGLRRIDPVLAVVAAFFLGLAVFWPGQALDSLIFVADAFLWLAPFLAVSVLLAGWLRAAGADQAIAAITDRSPAVMILLAAAAGAFSPFCSCGVVPIIAALLAAGMPLAPVMAFWLASPVMDPEMFVLTAAAIGPGFAIAKAAAAFGIGLAGGALAHGLVRAGRLDGILRPGIGGCGSGCGAKSATPTLRWAVWREPERLRTLLHEAWQAAYFLSKWLLLAFAIESLMAAHLPPDLVAGALGNDNAFAIPLAAAVGVPAYLNGYAAIPVVAELMRLGMAPGAAMTFMVAGGITSIPAAAAVLAVVRLPVFAVYVAMALLGALAAGYAYQLVI